MRSSSFVVFDVLVSHRLPVSGVANSSDNRREEVRLPCRGRSHFSEFSVSFLLPGIRDPGLRSTCVSDSCLVFAIIVVSFYFPRAKARISHPARKDRPRADPLGRLLQTASVPLVLDWARHRNFIHSSRERKTLHFIIRHTKERRVGPRSFHPLFLLGKLGILSVDPSLCSDSGLRPLSGIV